MTPGSPRLKSLTTTPDTPRAAEPSGPSRAVGAGKVVGRKAVRSAFGTDQQPDGGRFPRAWLRITAPSGAAPSARFGCACGHRQSAIGRTRVLALIDAHTAHRATCPLRNHTERRTAA
ncbi:hypothetical protein [Streptomyces sp. GSL17-111]|uniref:hypothetical protein n=1 Tax=Streptomyces sp. GSL17-111 TaxID=3121596 RepID=UPI0030F40525